MPFGHATNDVDQRPSGSPAMPRVVLRLFAAARQAAGTGRADVEAATVGAALATATARYGDGFAAVLAASRVWRNGEPTDADTPLVDGDEIAVLPPVSGGADGSRPARS